MSERKIQRYQIQVELEIVDEVGLRASAIIDPDQVYNGQVMDIDPGLNVAISSQLLDALSRTPWNDLEASGLDVRVVTVFGQNDKVIASSWLRKVD